MAPVATAAHFDRPVFLVAAARAGASLLFELLAGATSAWRTGGARILDQIPGLDPAGRATHRLTERDADPATVRAVHAALAAAVIDRHGAPPREPIADARVLAWLPASALRVSFLVAAFPDARFVFLHRDPRQSVSSTVAAWRSDPPDLPALPGWSRGAWHGPLPEGWRDLDGAPLDQVAAFQWSAANQHALDDLELVPAEHWCGVDWQELWVAPGAAVERIARAVGLPLDDDRDRAPPASMRWPPSPIRWLHDPDFHASSLARYTLIMGRLRELGRRPAAPPPPRSWAVPVRFACAADGAAPVPDRCIVHPSFQLQLGATVPLGLVRRARFRERFVDDVPLLWIEDPATHALLPFAARRADAVALQRLAAGAAPPPLPDELAGRLARVGVLTSAAAEDDRRRAGAALVEAARPHFGVHRWCALPSVIPAAQADALARYFEALIEGGRWQLGDAQVDRRHGMHNEPIARFFQHQLADFVGRVAGEPVRPSYCYVSAYRAGAILAPHVDRKQCEFTVSLWIERAGSAPAAPWPLWFHEPDGIVAVTQSSTDAVLFRGCELPHWRDRPPPGGAATTLLFHYVPRNFSETLD